MQSFGGEIKGPATAEAGSTVEIEVQGDAPEIEIALGGSGSTTKLPVGPDRKVQVPVPNEPGRVLIVTTTGKPPIGSITILIVSPLP